MLLKTFLVKLKHRLLNVVNRKNADSLATERKYLDIKNHGINLFLPE